MASETHKYQLKSNSAKYIVGYALDLFNEKKLHLGYNDLLKILKK